MIFRPLGRSQIRHIVTLQVDRIAQRLTEKRIRLVLTDAALARASDAGYDPLYGARPLKRWLERSLVNPLSVKIVAGELPDGAEVLVDSDAEEGLLFEVRPETVGGEPPAKRKRHAS